MPAEKGSIPWNKGKKGLQVAWNKGKRWPAETKLKMRLIKLGKHASYETKQKMSLIRKGEGNSFYGKKHTPESIQKMREKLSKYYQMHHGSFYGKKHTSRNIQQNRERQLRYLQTHDSPFKKIRLHQIFPKTDTSIEIILQTALTEKGIIFEKHKAISGQPDIFIEPNISVFLDGCYWHNCRQCFDQNKFNGKQRLKIVYDLMITQKLTSDGYMVLRFWEHDINNNLQGCLDQILSVVQLHKIV